MLQHRHRRLAGGDLHYSFPVLFAGPQHTVAHLAVRRCLIRAPDFPSGGSHRAFHFSRPVEDFGPLPSMRMSFSSGLQVTVWLSDTSIAQAFTTCSKALYNILQFGRVVKSNCKAFKACAIPGFLVWLSGGPVVYVARKGIWEMPVRRFQRPGCRPELRRSTRPINAPGVQFEQASPQQAIKYSMQSPQRLSISTSISL